jgi:hypothetical protein
VQAAGPLLQPLLLPPLLCVHLPRGGSQRRPRGALMPHLQMVLLQCW